MESMAKAILQVGEHPLSFDLERDALRQVKHTLAQTHTCPNTLLIEYVYGLKPRYT